jgi:hypothetical protein
VDSASHRIGRIVVEFPVSSFRNPPPFGSGRQMSALRPSTMLVVMLQAPPAQASAGSQRGREAQRHRGKQHGT